MTMTVRNHDRNIPQNHWSCRVMAMITLVSCRLCWLRPPNPATTAVVYVVAAAAVDNAAWCATNDPDDDVHDAPRTTLAAAAATTTTADNDDEDRRTSDSPRTNPPPPRQRRWDPKDRINHKCTVTTMTMNEFVRQYTVLPALYPTPLVIRRPRSPRRSQKEDEEDEDKEDRAARTHFAHVSQAHTILDSFPVNYTVTLSSSNSYSEHRRSVPFADYLEELATTTSTANNATATAKANETWYLFGETYSNEWNTFLTQYLLPPCAACDSSSSSTATPPAQPPRSPRYPPTRTTTTTTTARPTTKNNNTTRRTPHNNQHETNEFLALAFGIGKSGSGVSWHVHGPGFSETIHGRKHWLLYPPHHQQHYKAAATSSSFFSSNQTSLHWMETNYYDTTTTDTTVRDVRPAALLPPPLECTIYPGDIIYFPDMWWHATINIDDYTAFVSTFVQDHLYVERQQEKQRKQQQQQENTAAIVWE